MNTNPRRFLHTATAIAVGTLVAAVWPGLPAAAAAEETAASMPLNSLEAVNSRVRIGAQIFLDPGHTKKEIEMHFARMKEVGLTLVRMFIIWDHVERRPGQLVDGSRSLEALPHHVDPAGFGGVVRCRFTGSLEQQLQHYPL